MRKVRILLRESMKEGPGMTADLTTIGFDADDTLWHNEQFFRITQQRFCELLCDYAESEHLMDRLLDAERRNIGRYGFGIKGFVLSMIETAIDVTQERVPASVIKELIAAGQDMLHHPIKLLPYAQEAVAAMADRYHVLLITKGDLLDQERKLAQSGLGDLFDGVEIVSVKTAQVYRNIFHRHAQGPEHAMMVGNSIKSDVVPIIQAGGWGVHVPHGQVWALEHEEPPHGHARFHEIPDLGALAGLVARLS